MKGEDGKYVWEETEGGGGHVKHEDGPLQNARDHFEAWWKSLYGDKTEAEKQADSCYRDVSPHFKD